MANTYQETFKLTKHPWQDHRALLKAPCMTLTSEIFKKTNCILRNGPTMPLFPPLISETSAFSRQA